MTEVEKSSIPNINAIVAACEEVFKQERQAWLSTSLSQRLVVQNAKASAAAGGGSDGGGGDSDPQQQVLTPQSAASSSTMRNRSQRAQI